MKSSVADKKAKEAQALENREFVCSSCDKCFRNKAALYAHLRTCKNGPVPYEPKWSNPKFPKEQRDFVDYFCELCNKTFKNKAAIIAHQKSCTGDDIFCSECNAQFRTRKKLSKHLSVQHNSMKHTCYICGEAYKQKWLMEEHIARHTVS